MKNKKYAVTMKNGGCIPIMQDPRFAMVQIPCGNCIECRQKKTREWTVRLTEELKIHKHAYFITLTFSNKELNAICKKLNLKECNAVAGYAVRHCLERWRKDHKKSIKHWLITELGHTGTERVHLHGLLFNNEPLEFTPTKEKNFYTWKYWKYGNIYVGNYCTQRTINYITKYINKIDTDHKGFQGQIFASPGIGKNYLEREICKTYHYTPGESKNYYTLPNGSRVNLPTYYKNKLYNEEERELIWKDSMDRGEIFIRGMQFNEKYTNPNAISNVIIKQQEVNKNLEYGTDAPEWRKRPYNVTQRQLDKAERDRSGETAIRKAERAAKLEEIIWRNQEFYKKMLKNNE